MRSETWRCLQINSHVRITQPSLLFCAPRLHVCATIGVEPELGRRQTRRDDVMRIDCDQACSVLTQVCHQMTDDDRQSAVSSCWMPLTSPRSSGHLAQLSVPPNHLLSKGKDVANLEEESLFFHLNVFLFFFPKQQVTQKRTETQSPFFLWPHSWISSPTNVLRGKTQVFFNAVLQFRILIEFTDIGYD